jgi:Mlc titration factor MtfA (ptsG expression regulator)
MTGCLEDLDRMGFFHPFRDRRRRELAAQPFLPEWAAIMDSNVPYVRKLDAAERVRLESLIQVFVAEKCFEGCGGMVITDEVKVTIAAQACLLLLNLHHDYYEQLISILVYPAGVRFDQQVKGEAGTVSTTGRVVSGLSYRTGAVLLSWPDVKAGGRNWRDGRNVVFHEFAHQLDQLDGAVDGAPPLDSAEMYREWAHVLGAEYKRLRERVTDGMSLLISSYGATKPAEFFAVVTELFFERPLELRHMHPALYAEFMQYFRQDPAARLGGAG